MSKKKENRTTNLVLHLELSTALWFSLVLDVIHSMAHRQHRQTRKRTTTRWLDLELYTALPSTGRTGSQALILPRSPQYQAFSEGTYS